MLKIQYNIRKNNNQLPRKIYEQLTKKYSTVWLAMINFTVSNFISSFPVMKLLQKSVNVNVDCPNTKKKNKRWLIFIDSSQLTQLQAPRTNLKCDQWPLHSESSVNTTSMLDQQIICENKMNKLNPYLNVTLQVSCYLANNHIQQ